MDNDLDVDVSTLQQILLQLSFASRRRLAQELGNYGLTIPQYSVLRALSRNLDGMSMSNLADACHQVSATMTGIVDRLAERELVRRQQDPQDRRAQLVHLTQNGHIIINEIETQQTIRLNRVLTQLSPAERKDMLSMMKKYLEIIQEEAKS